LNGLYFDAAYLAKCYLNEPDSAAVRNTARLSPVLHTSAFSIAEMACVFHRHLREGVIDPDGASALRDLFLEDLRNGMWFLSPVTDRVLRQVELLVHGLPRTMFLRAGDAIHIVSAVEARFNEIWTNDRHLLAAAAHFGLKGRSVKAARK
jgi:predicted nucleic acid-binding protein